MPNPSRFVFVVAVLTAAASIFDPGARAQSAPSPKAENPEVAGSLTLQDAILRGLAHNASLASGRAEAAAAGADLEASRAARWPRLLTEVGWHRTDNQVLVFGDTLTAAEFTSAGFAIDSLNHPAPVDHATAAVTLEVPLSTSGRIRSGIQAAGEISLAAAARVRGAEIETVAGITESYYGVVLAAAAVRTAESALENASAHEAVARARFENGTALKSDWLRVRVHRLAREREVERSKADLEMARSSLRVLIGLPDGTLPPLATTDVPDPAGGPGDLQDWLQGVADSRPDLEAARRAAVAARAQGRAESAARGPEVAGRIRYERDAAGLDTGDGSFFAGVGIRWTAFDRGRAARIEAARARADAASALSRAAEDRARLEVERAYRDADVSIRNLSATHEAVVAAEEARRISADRYASGLLPLTDLLDAETALLQARLAEISARFDSVVGRVRLERAAGRLEVPR
jgi:outer membrane protein TolC